MTYKWAGWLHNPFPLGGPQREAARLCSNSDSVPRSEALETPPGGRGCVTDWPTCGPLLGNTISSGPQLGRSAT